MQSTTSTYQELLRQNHFTETKITIAGVEYGENDILSLRTYGGAFSDLQVGQAISREIQLTVYPKDTIPKMAKICVFTRLSNGTTVSEWLPKGEYFIATRERDKVTGTLTIHGYDAMLKAEQTYLPEGETGTWPKSVIAAVNEIKARMGVDLDQRTVLNSSYMVEYPNEITMRDELCYIAAAHGGNWVITDAGKLRLIVLGAIPAESYFMVTEYGDAIVMGDVRLVV